MSRHLSKIFLAGLAFGSVLAASAAEAPAPTYGPVERGTTLWGVAKKLQPEHPHATVAQMANALYRANPQAFTGGVAGLRAGAVLKIPDKAFIEAVSAKVSKEVVLNKAPLTTASKAKPVAPAVPPAAAPTPEAPVATPAPTVVPVTPVRSEAAAEVKPSPLPAASFTADEAKALALLAVSDRYQALQKREADLAGDVQFDYALGLAALDTGDAGEAIFPLQRAVAADPSFFGARMELARAYFNAGENEAARSEFLLLQQQSPPPKAAEVIKQYLEAIDRRAAKYQPRKSFYGEVGSGYDSNANAATDADTLVFNGVAINLNADSQETESPYASAGAGMVWSAPLSPRSRTYGQAGISHRLNSDAHFVDSSYARVMGGFDWDIKSYTLSTALGYQATLIDRDFSNRLTSADLGLSHAYGETWKIGASLRFGALRYDNASAALTDQNVNQWIYGVFSQGYFAADPRTIWAFGLVGGTDNEMGESANAQSFGRSLYGGRVSATRLLTPRLNLFAGLSSLRSNYGGLVAGIDREDRLVSAQGGLEWKPTFWDGLALRTQFTVTDNQSNVSFRQYDRTDIGFTARKEFP